MTRPDLFNELLDRAFRLAYFTCADREAALRVTSGAMLKLEVAAHAQAKRLYYTPARKSDVVRTKVILRSEEHTSELQSPCNLLCRLLLEKKKHPQFATNHL